MRIALDSDILSAAYTEDGKIQKYWQKGGHPHTFLISPEIFTAVEIRLRQSRLEPIAIQNILKDILKRCALVRPKEIYAGEITDEADRPIVTLAHAAEGDLILTGKATLQKMKTAGGIPIQSFSQFRTQSD